MLLGLRACLFGGEEGSDASGNDVNSSLDIDSEGDGESGEYSSDGFRYRDEENMDSEYMVGLKVEFDELSAPWFERWVRRCPNGWSCRG
jgi:hypothetical protein